MSRLNNLDAVRGAGEERNKPYSFGTVLSTAARNEEMRQIIKSSTKILFVITQGTWGGAQRNVLDLATHLKKLNWDVHLAAGKNHWGELMEKAQALGIKTHALAHLGRTINPASNLRFIIELTALIAKLSPRIVHFHSTNAGIFGPIAVRRAKKILKYDVACVYTAHGFPFNEPGAIKGMAYKKLERWASKYRDAIICVSQYDCDSAIRAHIAPEKKFTVIHNGVGASSANLLPRDEARTIFASLPPDAILIGTIAQFYKTKGLIYLVRAAKLIAAKYSHIYFAAIGGGRAEKNLAEVIAELGLQTRFFLAPYQSNGSSYLSAFDIIAAPSLKEGLPYFLLEAGLAQKPVVATSVGGVPEIITDNQSGLLVEPANPAVLAEAIEKLLENENLRMEYGAELRKKVLKEFSLQVMLQKTERVYRALSSS